MLVNYYLSDILAINKLYFLAGVDEQFPVNAGRWTISVNVDHVNFGNVKQTQYTQEEQEVHLAAPDPDHMPHVGRQTLVRRQ